MLGTLKTTGILLKSYHEFKNIKTKTDLLKFSVTSYEKVFTNLREAMQGGEWNYKEFIHDMKSWIERFWIYLPRSLNLRKNMLKNLHPMSDLYFKQGIPRADDFLFKY